jgi:hypothetical protein
MKNHKKLSPHQAVKATKMRSLTATLKRKIFSWKPAIDLLEVCIHLRGICIFPIEGLDMPIERPAICWRRICVIPMEGFDIPIGRPAICWRRICVFPVEGCPCGRMLELAFAPG